jgi:hypothetical protein
MNGFTPKIEIFKPFGEAFELMKKILFQPFDFKKWCVIGFAAFLTYLNGGGFPGFHFPGNWVSNTSRDREDLRSFITGLDPIWWVLIGILILVAIRDLCRSCLGEGAGTLHFHRLHCAQPWGNRAALERIPGRGQ